MAVEFDPYYKWLGILPKDQPPHHYRLLGIEVFEDDLQVIEAAADRQLSRAPCITMSMDHSTFKLLIHHAR